MKIFIILAALLLSSTSFAFVNGYSPYGDIHWKTPVADVGSLPSSGNSIGDVRFELTAFGEYIWNGVAWQAVTGGGGGGGTVTSVSVVTANGFAGTVAASTTTPAITIETTVSGILFGNGTAVAAAIAANFPTLNQNTTGTASNVTGIVAVPNGGTGDTSFTASLPILGNGVGALTQGTVSGNTTDFATASGALTSGNCLTADASGNVSSTGAPCGTGSGTITAVTGVYPIVSSGGTTPAISITSLLPATAQDVYVSLAGSDTACPASPCGDGSNIKPYATITQALSYINGSGLNNSVHPFIVHIGAGTFQTTAAEIPCWTFMVGASQIGTKWNDTSNAISVNSACFSAGSERLGFQSMTLINSTGLNIDFQAIGGAGSDQLYVNDLQINGATTLTGRGGDAVTWYNTRQFGSYTSKCAQEFGWGGYFSGSTSYNTTGVTSTDCAPEYIGTQFFSNASFTSSGAGNTMTPELISAQVSGTLTIDQSTTNVTADNVSAAGTISQTNGGILTYLGAEASASITGLLKSSDWTTFNNKQPAGSYITALTGDGTAIGPGSVAFTLATVNGNVGSFGSSTSIPNFTVNAKGLITAAGGNAVIAPAGTLSGTTLNATVVSSSLTSVGTIASGTWNGSTVTVPFGGTGDTTFTASLPILGNGAGALTQGTVSGNTTDFATASGALTSGNCLQADASGNIVSTVGPCGTSTGTVTGSGTTNQITKWNNTAGNLVDSDLADNGTTVSLTSGINLSMSGASTLTTGTGAVSLNGSATLAKSKTLTYSGATSGTFIETVPGTVTSYTITWPAAAAASAGQVLSSDTAGVLSWSTPTVSPGSITLTQNDILVGNASNVAADVAMSGDATIVSSGALTLATVNGNVGSFGSSTSIPNFTVNAKGLITAAGGNVVIAPAGTLSGTTLNATVVSSSLTSVGTIATGVWNGSTVTVPFGGTGDTTFTSNLPLIGNGAGAIAQGTVSGNTTEFATASGALTSGNCVKIDASGNLVDFGAPCSSSTGTVTSVAFSDGSTTPIFTITGSPVTTSGTLTETLSTQSANLVFAGPASGAAAQPTFRSLNVADETIANQAQATCTTASTIDWSTGNSFTLLLTSGDACTLTFSNPTSGQTITLWLTNGSAGGTATVVWPTAKWFPAGAPTMTTGTAALDVCTCTYNGTSYACNCLQNGG